MAESIRFANSPGGWSNCGGRTIYLSYRLNVFTEPKSNYRTVSKRLTRDTAGPVPVLVRDRIRTLHSYFVGLIQTGLSSDYRYC